MPARIPPPDTASEGASDSPVPPESFPFPQPGPGLDRLGWTQAIGGLALALIALFTSYDHITLAGHDLPLNQQWGIVFILASLATVLVDAELASRSRFRDATTRLEERNRADQERSRADQERDRAAEARERQAESLEHLDQAALLSAGVLLEASDVNRARLRDFLTQVSPRPVEEQEF